jgi:DNA-binding response OmpR family regulator
VLGSILLIDYDAAITGELEAAFVREGYAADTAAPGVAALRKLLVEEPDLVILGLDCVRGEWGFCQRVLTFLENPLLLLLTTEDKLDRTRGLEMGADDCMIKPVITAEVVARTRALLRRNAMQATQGPRSLFVDERFVIDLACREVRLDGQCVILTPTEFRVLCCLAKHAGQVLSPDRLALQVWGTKGKGSPETVKVYVHRLRQKLEVDPRHPQRIVTRRGIGYLFSVRPES